MRPYSLDLRERIVQALAEGQTYQQVAQRFNVSVPTVGRYQRLAKIQDTLAPKPLPGRKLACNQEEQEQLRQLIEQRQDWTIASLQVAWQEQTGKLISSSCLHHWMRRLGFSHKKRVASPQNETPKRAKSDEKPTNKQ